MKLPVFLFVYFFGYYKVTSESTNKFEGDNIYDSTTQTETVSMQFLCSEIYLTNQHNCFFMNFWWISKKDNFPNWMSSIKKQSDLRRFGRCSDVFCPGSVFFTENFLKLSNKRIFIQKFEKNLIFVLLINVFRKLSHNANFFRFLLKFFLSPNRLWVGKKKVIIREVTTWREVTELSPWNWMQIVNGWF